MLKTTADQMSSSSPKYPRSCRPRFTAPGFAWACGALVDAALAYAVFGDGALVDAAVPPVDEPRFELAGRVAEAPVKPPSTYVFRLLRSAFSRRSSVSCAC